MGTIYDIRRANLRLLVAKEPKQAVFARKIGKDPRQVSQWLGKAGARNISDATAREIEEALRLPRGHMDKPALRVVESAQAPADTDRVARLERELDGVIGLLSILLHRLGTQAPNEGAAVVFELRQFLATPEYEGEALPELLHTLEQAVPSYARDARGSDAKSGK